MIKGIVNSSIALTTAYLLTIILHEIAHYLMSISLGYETALYHNYIYYVSSGSKMHDILIAGIGPLFSLILGVIAYSVSKKIKTSPISLFALWLGIAGLVTFFGYLMIAPLIPVGDTGKVFSLLNIPMWLQIIISIFAIIAITIILIKSTNQFEKYATEDFGSIKINRQKWSVSLILIPLILSIILISLLQLPIPHIASILATVCAPFSIMAVFGTFIGRKDKLNRDLDGISINNKISTMLIAALVIMVIINRILVYGI